MKNPLLMGAVGVLVVSNAFVLIPCRVEPVGRAGRDDGTHNARAAENSNFTIGEDSMVTFTLTFQNPGPDGWFDRNKMAELGFDTSVPAESKDASRYYMNARSREVFVALEYDGPAWQRWLVERESQVQREAQYGSGTQIPVARASGNRPPDREPAGDRRCRAGPGGFAAQISGSQTG